MTTPRTAAGRALWNGMRQKFGPGTLGRMAADEFGPALEAIEAEAAERRATVDPDALTALRQLFVVLEQLDRRVPSPDYQVTITQELWVDFIRPRIATVQRAILDAEYARLASTAEANR